MDPFQAFQAEIQHFVLIFYSKVELAIKIRIPAQFEKKPGIAQGKPGITP